MVDELTDGGERPAKGPNVGLQVAAAMGLVAVALGAMWGLGTFRKPADGTDAGKPAGCQARKSSDAAEYPALCAALNRPDLPVLIGAPSEHVVLAQSAGSTFTYPDGTKESDAAAEVQLGTYNVRLTDNQDVSVQALADVTDSVQPTTVLGHAALTYSDHTLEITFGGGQSGGGTGGGSGTGGVARHLVVAKSAKDGGGSFELAIWRQDGTTPDAASLLRIAEQVLPAAPGWVAGT
ncbi:DUF6215 domain-containing protein [Streptacidiphilus anmyonensis]|uniref:DUF6215 domain-containing protein n=1 Tax=Streptacidiphilus anmyonensis TaxID=405782 RepID=UPI0005A72F3C|nr:DUF6215 domain-containing protein [Streptacidiphilus anmyonensis]